MKRKSFFFVFCFLSSLLIFIGLSIAENEHPTNVESPKTGVSAPVHDHVPAASGGFSGVIIETMNSGGYTYVLIDTGSEKKWAAGPGTKVAVGDRVSVPDGSPMPGFKSNTLDRTFDLIYFVQEISPESASKTECNSDSCGHASSTKSTEVKTATSEGNSETCGNKTTSAPTPGQAHSSVPTPEIIEPISVKKLDGGNTIAEIYAQKATLAGKEIKVRGKVVKFSAMIMGKNWVHIQDGTGKNSENDLTVTTSEIVKAGDTVIVIGKLSTDKDFGYGYKYPVIVEDGKVAAE